MAVLEGNYCPTSGKECFDTKGDAQKAMHRLDKKGTKKGAVYFCPDCNKWHITHYGYSKSKNIRQTKIKNDMAGTGKFKIGSELKFKDNLGSPLKCGDFVRNTITGTEGVITQYGVVKSNNGNYKLCDNIWEVVTKKDEPSDISIGAIESEATELIGEHKEKTLDDFSVDEIIHKVFELDDEKKLTAEQEVMLSDFAFRRFFADQCLADELRKRGYEVMAEKTVKVIL